MVSTGLVLVQLSWKPLCGFSNTLGNLAEKQLPLQNYRKGGGRRISQDENWPVSSIYNIDFLLRSWNSSLKEKGMKNCKILLRNSTGRGDLLRDFPVRQIPASIFISFCLFIMQNLHYKKKAKMVVVVEEESIWQSFGFEEDAVVQFICGHESGSAAPVWKLRV